MTFEYSKYAYILIIIFDLKKYKYFFCYKQLRLCFPPNFQKVGLSIFADKYLFFSSPHIGNAPPKFYFRRIYYNTYKEMQGSEKLKRKI